MDADADADDADDGRLQLTQRALAFTLNCVLH